MKSLKCLGVVLFLLLILGLVVGCSENNSDIVSNDSTYGQVSQNSTVDLTEPIFDQTLSTELYTEEEYLTTVPSEEVSTTNTVNIAEGEEEVAGATATTTKKETPTTTKSKECTTTKKTTPTIKKTTTTTKKPTTTKPTTTQASKILYYYEDGTKGYEAKPGARFYANGCWQVVSSNTVTDDEIIEAGKTDEHGSWY